MDIKGDNIINININIKLYIKLIGIVDSIILLLLRFSDINLLIPVVIDRVPNVIKRLKVGNIDMYKIVPSSFMLLVKNILIMSDNILVILPPNISMNVDFKNLFFIFNCMFFLLNFYLCDIIILREGDFMYHFIGIKGAGMSSLAIIMKQLGYDVKGSDLGKHFFTEVGLSENNIEFTEYNENNINEGMTIVRGLSITKENPEYSKALELGLEIIDYNEMVGILTRKFKTICVAGCHGKTTTTSMIAHVFNKINGINYLVGDGTGCANKDNEMFVLESCEYQRHFLSYLPYYAIILNIDLDHVDYFKDIDDVINAYEEYANSCSKMIIANGDDDNVRKMNINKNISYFGLGDDNNVIAGDIEYTSEGTNFSVYVDGNLYGNFSLPIYGEHQLYDALATISVCYYEGIESKLVGNYFESFSGAKRRFSETFVKDNIIIDDYAHHPNEVKATINAIKQKYPDKFIVSIFQPHTFTRTMEFANDLAVELGKTDVSYILDIHPAREKQEDYPDVTSDIIISKMTNGNHITVNDAEVLNQYKGAVFIFMSPNDLSKLENDLMSLKEKE